tara:strand:+ start:6811 stop:8841 length:2031 start_codon:yes stop_codon:yes gene_type:complete
MSKKRLYSIYLVLFYSIFIFGEETNSICIDPFIGGIEDCFNAGPSSLSATRSNLTYNIINEFDYIRFEWNQCTSGGLVQVYLWEDNGGIPGNDIYSELVLNTNDAGWNHILISTSSLDYNPNLDLWAGIREFTATQAIGMYVEGNGCSAINYSGNGWESLSDGNLAYRLTTCIEDNPAGCFETGCAEGYICLDDAENNCVSSNCDCNENTGDWNCDNDCNGGTCFLQGCMDLNACNYNPDATISDESCAYELDCAGICGGNTVEDVCGICGGNSLIEEECLQYICNMEMKSYLGFGQGASDITGFYQDGREFAVVGLVEDAAAFVDITDPGNPVEVGRIIGTPSIWRDIKYWNRHIYIGTEAQDGVKVISVDDLDNPTHIYTILDFTNSHNIHIDVDGYLYVVGAAEHDIWIYELTDHPENPILVGTWNGEYLHDIEVYNNKLYGAGIYSGQFYILDVSDKGNPVTLLTYQTGGVMTHDCAVTYDEQYLITADETSGGHIKIWDISNYDNINMVSEYITHPDHSVHNVYIRPGTNLAIMSYYVDGTRILDISDPYHPIEVGYFDTSDLTGLYDGNWGTYAYLPSGYIISSDREKGLFVFDSPITNSSLEWSDCSVVLGDVNFDGSVNILDIVRIANYILTSSGFTDIQINLADMNTDGSINILDIIIVVNIILQIG